MSDLLDLIATLPVDDAAQAHAREWAQQASELQKRLLELVAKQQALLDALDAVGTEADKVSAELSELCHRMGDVASRTRKPVETMQ